MSYEKFAYLYDELMRDAPYDQWVEFMIKTAEKHQVSGQKLLDLACGTGELSIRFAEAGYQVTGVDLSADMLAVAQAKAADSNVNIPFFEQNMAELTGLDQFDMIGIFCDSLNYLSSEGEVFATFEGVFRHLRSGGLFIFDVHSLYKMMHVFMNQTYAFNEEEISYIWQIYEGEFPNSVEHDLSFFVLDEETNRYDRYDELHLQRTFPISIYESWLKKAGFDLLEIAADFETGSPQEQSERIFFICRKP